MATPPGATGSDTKNKPSWAPIGSLSTTQETTTTGTSRVSGSWTKLGFRIKGAQKIEYFVDGVNVATHETTTAFPTAALGWGWGVKNLTTNGESLLVDWVKVVQLR